MKLIFNCVRFFLLFLPLSLCADIGKLGVPFILNHSKTVYQAGTQNWAIDQSALQVLYFGNNHGLLEYDGAYWQLYPVSNRTIIRSVDVGKDGKVYVGAQGEFGYFENKNNLGLQYISLKDKLPAQYQNFDDVWRTYVFSDRVIFSTFSYIFIYKNEKIEVIPATTQFDFSFRLKDRFYIVEWGKGLLELNDTQLNLLPGGGDFANKGVSAMLAGKNGKIIISTYREGLYEYNGFSFTPWITKVDQQLKESQIYCAVSLKSGNYALGTSTNGLFIINEEGELVLHLSKEKGLQNRTILSLFEDLRGDLWLGLDHGITYVELNSPFAFINEQVGLPGAGYSSLIYNNKLYLGTNNGLFFTNINGRENFVIERPFEEVPGTKGQVWNLQLLKGNLVMGHHDGAFLILPSGVKRISSEIGAWVFMELKKHPGFMIGGTYTGLNLYKFLNGSWEFVKKIKGFSESSRVMEEDQDGYIWITHGYKGVFKIKLSQNLDKVERVQFYDKSKGFPSNLFINVFKVSGKLLFGTEKDVFHYNSTIDSFEVYHPINKYFKDSNYVRKLAEDSSGNIWYSEGNEIGLLRKKRDGGYEVDKILFNKLQGSLIGGFENFYPIKDNAVLIGTQDGFVFYNRTIKKDYLSPYFTLIRKMELIKNKDSLVFIGNTQSSDLVKMKASLLQGLPYKQNSVRFTFSSTYYVDPDKIIYKYFLEGFDQDWTVTDKTEKEYTNLHEGNYTFHVKAVNLYGLEGSEATYTFSVDPPWYRSSQAYIGYVVMGLFAIGFLYNLLEKKHERTKQKEIDRLTKKSEEEIIKLKNEKLESEVEHKNRELATSTMHLLNKNEILNQLKVRLSQIIREDDLKSSENQVVKLIKVIDQNMQMDNEWDNFEVHFDQVHEDFLKRLKKQFPKLTPNDLKLCAYLRMNLSTKEIATLLNISPRGVEISRYRLRKKLNLESEVNLVDFVMNV